MEEDDVPALSAKKRGRSPDDASHRPRTSDAPRLPISRVELPLELLIVDLVVVFGEEEFVAEGDSGGVGRVKRWRSCRGIGA